MERFGARGRHLTVNVACDRDLGSGFEAFYARSVQRASQFAHLLTGSTAACHDIAHDALAAVHARWEDLENPDAYLRVVVVNLSRSAQRRWIREREVLRRARPAVTSNPEFDDAWRVVRRLPIKQREVIVLRFYEDLSVPEIADVLGVPTGTVNRRCTEPCAN